MYDLIRNQTMKKRVIIIEAHERGDVGESSL